MFLPACPGGHEREVAAGCLVSLASPPAGVTGSSGLPSGVSGSSCSTSRSSLTDSTNAALRGRHCGGARQATLQKLGAGRLGGHRLGQGLAGAGLLGAGKEVFGRWRASNVDNAAFS
jgi:hypothetical protein